MRAETNVFCQISHKFVPRIKFDLAQIARRIAELHFIHQLRQPRKTK
jgi:hypothetical protein